MWNWLIVLVTKLNVILVHQRNSFCEVFVSPVSPVSSAQSGADLLLHGVTALVPVLFGGFNSNLFTVLEEDRVRPMLGLMALNCYVCFAEVWIPFVQK